MLRPSADFRNLININTAGDSCRQERQPTVNIFLTSSDYLFIIHLYLVDGFSRSPGKTIASKAESSYAANGGGIPSISSLLIEVFWWLLAI
jgi:hypothetical protein